MTTAAPTIDLWSSASFSSGHPRDQYRWLRQNAPVHWHEEPGGRGFWAVTRYEDVRAISRDSATFSSSPTVMMQDASGGGTSHMMLYMDPPEHTRYRNLVKGGFTPRAVQPRGEVIAALARRIVDEVIERGECDFVEDVAGKLPSYVIAGLMGIPLEDGVMLYELTEKMHSAPDAISPEERGTAARDMLQYAAKVAAEKRTNPGDDLATQLVQSEIDGDRLSEQDFLSFFLLLINAGGDTTRNLVGGGMHALFEHPEERARLQADLDGLLPTAIEEMLRYLSPVTYMRRTATRDTELRGQAIRAGDKVIMYYGAANSDEDIFPDGDRFDVGREPNEHQAFGSGGAHYCLGSHIARVEVQALFHEVLTRLPDIERAGPTTWFASNFICGPTHLPVRFTPGKPLG